jgi:hypothetical protein
LEAFVYSGKQNRFKIKWKEENKLSTTYFAYPRSKLAGYYGEKECQSPLTQGTQRLKSSLSLQGARHSAVANKLFG